MKFPRHMVITISVSAILVCFLGSDAMAQGYAPGGPPPGYYYQPPSMIPTGPSMYPGVFYISGGVRYYNNNGFRFNKPQQQTIVTGNIGTPPFGPDDGIFPGQPGFGTPIRFGTGTPVTGLQAFPLAPTYVITDDPRISGIWFYQNGKIDARDPGLPPAVSCVEGTPPLPVTCTGSSDVWPDPIFPLEQLGRFTVIAPECCTETTRNRNTGSWGILDPFLQANNPSSISGTTTISFQRMIDGTYNATIDPVTGLSPNSGEVASIILNVDPAVFDNEVFRAQLWAPAIEIGFQATSLFDIYFGFSGYQTGQSFAKSFNYLGVAARRGFVDTFGFAGSQDTAWSIGAFDSSSTVIGSDIVARFQIGVDGSLHGEVPTRTFFLAGTEDVPTENLQEDVTNKSDINLLEFRWAGRSWVPLWGMGRFGFSLGAIANAINYKISGTRTITALGPNFPGTIALSEIGKVDAWIANYGGFFGTDVEVGVRNLFFKASGDYHFITPKFTYQLMSIETEFDPTGWSLGLYGGLRF